MDNAPAHPPDLEESLSDEFSFITVKFLPPNTTPLLQPMDQNVISNFKKLYTKALFQKCFQATTDTQLTLTEFLKEHFSILSSIYLIDIAWSQVTSLTLISAWRNLWPACDSECRESTLTSDTVSSELKLNENIISLGKSMGLEIEYGDIEELVGDNSTEFITKVLLHLHHEQENLLKEASFKENGEEEEVQSSDIKELLTKWSELKLFVEKFHPDIKSTNRAIDIFNDNVMSYFRKILQHRYKQPTLDMYFSKEKGISNIQVSDDEIVQNK